MKTNKKGISLIVLIVTIIVIIILAAVIILTINKNNPVNSAKEAVFREDINSFATELEIYKANMKYKGENPEELNANKETTPDIQEVITSMSNKYTKVLEVRNGKLVYIGKDTEGYRLAYKIGILPEDELVDDDILEELQPFITEWTVEAGDTITLPINTYLGNKYNFNVDYGDGSGKYNVTGGTDEDRMHTYEESGTYTVTITGQCPSFDFGSGYIADLNAVNESKNKLTKVVQWGNVIKNKGGLAIYLSIGFPNCTSLKGPIPEPSKNSFKNVLNINNLFSGCTNLTGNIPESLFANCPNVTNLDAVFYNCKNLTGSIPEKLFFNCSKIKNFSSTFQGCTGLTGQIPEKLFVNCVNAEQFGLGYSNGCFYGCTNLNGSIPEKLFINCTKVTFFSSVFRDCSNLTGRIPENLFVNCVNVTDFNGTFQGCSGLSESIPEKLFANCPNVVTFGTTYWSGCFQGCSSLSGEIPQNLFYNNKKATKFAATFRDCVNLIGNAPELWNRENVEPSTNCFSNCKRLSNYSEIPKSWGGGGS